MNNTTTKQITVLAVFGLLTAALSSIQTVGAQETNFMPYGSIGQEDESAVYHDGHFWVNTGANLGIGNGQFMKITDLDNDYTIDQAIERFGIYEDTESFIVQPSLYSNTVFLFEIDNNGFFQLVDIYTDNETGFYKFVMQNENSD